MKENIAKVLVLVALLSVLAVSGCADGSAKEAEKGKILSEAPVMGNTGMMGGTIVSVQKNILPVGRVSLEYTEVVFKDGRSEIFEGISGTFPIKKIVCIEYRIARPANSPLIKKVVRIREGAC